MGNLEFPTNSRLFRENDVNAAPSEILSDATVVGGDFSSGGSVSISGLLEEDALSVSDEGTGIGQIGFDAISKAVSYESTVIGNVGERSLDTETMTYSVTIALENGVTTEAVQALIRALLYGNSSDNPTFNRILQVSITDSTTETVSHELDVTVEAEDDAPTITAGAASNDLTEAGGTANGTAGTDASSITMTIADVDDGDAPEFDGTYLTALENGWSRSADGATYTKTGTYGTATLTVGTGDVTYVLDDSDTETQALRANDIVSDTFTIGVISNDKTATADAVFTINGADDAPTITAGAASNDLTEAGGTSNGTAGTNAASITMSIADVDTGDAPEFDRDYLVANGWTTTDSGETYTRGGTYGTATLTVATGVVAYLLDDDDADTQALRAGESETETFTIGVISNDKTATADAVFTINGANDVPTLAGLETSVSYQENTVNAVPQRLDTSVFFLDPDGNFDGGTLVVSGLLDEDEVSVKNDGTGAGQIGFDGTAVTFEGTTIGTFLDEGTSVRVTLNAAAGSRAVDALIEALVYRNTSDLPTSSRTFSVAVTDDSGAVAASDIEVRVVAENDAPRIFNLPGRIDFAENTINTTYVRLIPNPDDPGGFDVRDPEENYDGGSLRLSGLLNEDILRLQDEGSDPGEIGFDGVTVSFGGTAFATVTGGAATSTGTRADFLFTFNAAATSQAIETMLERLEFANPLDAPTVNRRLVMEITDGAGNVTDYPTPGTVSPSVYQTTLRILLQNDAVSGSGLPVSAVLLEGLTGTLDLSSLRLEEPDVTDVIDLTLSVTAGILAADPTKTVSATSSNGGRDLTLSGKAADLMVYLADSSVLRFTGPKDLAGVDAVTLTATATDAGPVTVGVGSIAISLTPIPDGPGIGGLPASVSFTESAVNTAAQPLGLAVVVSDPEDDFDGGVLRVSGLLPEETIAVGNAGSVTVSAADRIVSVDGVAIGSYSGGAGTDFVVTFNAAASGASVTAVVNALTFRQDSEAATSHDLRIEIIDGAGNGLGNAAGATVSFRAATDDETPFAGVDFGINIDPAFGDLDGDGDLDLVLGAVDGELTAYRNDAGVFTQFATNPLAGIDVGSRSGVAFADLDGDGRDELIVGDNRGGFAVYDVTGTGAIQRTGDDNPLEGLDIGTQGNAKPDFVDLDADGDLDLVAGGEDGRLHVYENTSSGFVAPVSFRNPFLQDVLNGFGTLSTGTVDLTSLKTVTVEVDQTSLPNPDLSDEDLATLLRFGLKDMHTANWSLALNGEAFTYLGAGESVTLTYSVTFEDTAARKITQNLSFIVTGTSDRPVIALGPLPAGATGETSQARGPLDVGSAANPAFGDLDGDGRVDVVIGDAEGSLRTFLNTGTGTGYRELIGQANPFSDVDPGTTRTAADLGVAAAPTLVDIDGDGDLDAVVGNRGGSLSVFLNTTARGAALRVAIQPENDTPDATGLPGDVVVIASSDSPLDLRTLRIDDPDVTDVLDLVFSADTGTLVAAASTDVAVSGTGTATLTLRGTAAALNRFLADVDRVRFRTDDDTPAGDDAGLLSLTVNDGSGAVALGDVNVDILDVAPGGGKSSLTGIGPIISLFENSVNTAPQRLDPDVFFASVSESFDGGRLTVSGALAEDRLSVQHVGTGTGQIGVVTGATGSPTVITFGGTEIGTLTGGSDAVPLAVLFNENATATAIDALIEQLAFATDSDAPEPIRTLEFTITDARGAGLSAPGPIAASFALGTGSQNILESIDIGRYSAPALGDVTGDGRPDLLMGDSRGVFSLFENTGTGFEAVPAGSSPFGQLDAGRYSSPALVDFDGDGDLDLVAGTGAGQIVSFANTTDGFRQLRGTANPFNGIDVGSFSTPTFVDLDRDGDLDLVIGDSFGRLTSFANVGGTFLRYASSPELQNPTEPFDGIDIGSRSAPGFLDFDADGDMDLFVIGSTGMVVGYENTEAGFTRIEASINPFRDIDVGSGGAIAFADIDADGDLDAVLGNSAGTAVVVENLTQRDQPVTVQVAVIAQDDAATASGFPATLSAAEDTLSSLDLSGLTLADPDTAEISLRLTAGAGTLFATGADGVVIAGSGSGSISLTGAVADLNAFLQRADAVTYVGAPNASGAAADSLTASLDDGSGFRTIGSAPIDIAPSNDAPLATGLPLSAAAVEDVAGAIDLSGLVLADADVDSVLTLTITASEGVLGATAAAGVTVAGSRTEVLSLSGAPAALNAFLSGGGSVSYTGAADAAGIGAATLALRLSDGIAASEIGSLRVDIEAVNDLPEVTVPPWPNFGAIQATPTALDLSDLVLFDAEGDRLSVTLEVTEGQLSTVGTVGVTLDGSGTERLTVSGSIAALQGFFDAGILYYTSRSTTTGVVEVTMAVGDGTGTFTFPFPIIEIEVVAPGGLAEASGLPAKLALVEDTASPLDLSTLQFDNPDSAELLFLELVVTTGNLTARVPETLTEVAVENVDASSVYLSGTAAALTAWFDEPDNLIYTGLPDQSGQDAARLRLRLFDFPNALPAGEVWLDIAAVNDAPVGSGMPDAFTALEDTASALSFGSLVLADADPQDTLVLRLTVDTGTLSGGAAPGVTLSGSGTSSLSASGSAAALNGWLGRPDAVSYTGAAEASGPAAATLVATIDDGSGPVAVGSAPIAVLAVNDAPTASGLPEDAFVFRGVPSALDLRGLAVADVDSGTLTLRLIAEDGILEADTADGVNVSGSGTPNLTLVGTPEALNALLSRSAPVTLTAPPSLSGQNATSVAVELDDGSGPVALGLVSVDLGELDGRHGLVNLAETVTLSRQALEAGPQAIDTTIAYAHATGDLAGGHLRVSGLMTGDVLGLRDAGTGAGSVGVSGSVVTFGGVEIGRLTGGQGTDLRVTFNAAATSAAVDALIESLTFDVSVEAPASSRTLLLDVVDADGTGLGDAALTAPVFTAAHGGADPLDGLDAGAYAAPGFVDLDGDGRLDLVAGNNLGRFVAWQNTPSGFERLTGAANPFAGIDIGSHAAPAFVDLDGDGDLDMVAGSDKGRIFAVLDTGTEFSLLRGAENPFDGIDIGSFARPSFADLDGDGDMDMVVGDRSGRLSAFENTATGFVQLKGSANPFSGLDAGSWSAPAFADLDGDGDLDLLVGKKFGNFAYYENSESGFTFMKDGAAPLAAAEPGRFAIPVFADLDGDRDRDLVVGNSAGQFSLFEDTTVRVEGVEIVLNLVDDFIL